MKNKLKNVNKNGKRSQGRSQFHIEKIFHEVWYPYQLCSYSRELFPATPANSPCPRNLGFAFLMTSYPKVYNSWDFFSNFRFFFNNNFLTLSSQVFFLFLLSHRLSSTDAAELAVAYSSSFKISAR